MLKVTKKTKKAELVMAAMERKLYASEEEANKQSNKVLYDAIMACDRVLVLAKEEEAQAEANNNVEIPVVEDTPKAESKSDKPKKSLPKPKAEKADDKAEEVKADAPVVEETKVATYTDVRPFREEMLRIVRKEIGINLVSVKKSKLQKANYTKSIDFINKAIEESMAKFNAGEFDEDTMADGTKVSGVNVKFSVINEEGKTLERSGFISKADIDERIGTPKPDIHIVPKQDEVKPTEQEPPKAEEKVDEKQDDRSEEEIETVDNILAVIEALKKDNVAKDKALAELQTKYDKACKICGGLDKKLQAMRKENNGYATRQKQMYTDIVAVANVMAMTKDEGLLEFWTALHKWIGKFVPAEGDSSAVFDMNKLIADVAKAEAKKDEVGEDVDYEGEFISFIDGEVVMPDGVKKRTFNKYNEMYENADEWIRYIADSRDRINGIKNDAKRKKEKKELLGNIKSWYRDNWSEYGDDVLDMVKDTISCLLNNLMPEILVRSYIVAVIDELEL